MGKSPKPWHSVTDCSPEEEDEGDAFLDAGKKYLPNSSFYVTTTRSGRPALARKNYRLLRDHGFDLLGQSFGIPSRIDYERGNHAETSPPRDTTDRAAPSSRRRHRELLSNDEVAPAKGGRASRRHRDSSTSTSTKTPRLEPVAYSTASAGLVRSETDDLLETSSTHVPFKASFRHRKHVRKEKHVSGGSDGSEAIPPRGIPPLVRHYLPLAPPAPPQSLQFHHPLQSVPGPYVPPYSAKATTGGKGYTVQGDHTYPYSCGRTHHQTSSYANLFQGHVVMADYAAPQANSLPPIPHQQADLASVPKLQSAFIPGFVVPPPPPPPVLPGTPVRPTATVKVTDPESTKAHSNDLCQQRSKGENIRTAGDSRMANKHRASCFKEGSRRTSAETFPEPDLFEYMHVCAACGKPRSRGYHMTHLVKRGERPEAGYCRRCVAHADYTDSETSATGTSRSFGVKNIPSPGLSTDEDFLISSGRYVHDVRSRRHKLHQKPRRSSFLKGFLSNSAKSRSSGRAPDSLSSAEEASSRASSLVQNPKAHSKIAMRRAARKKKEAQSRARPQLGTQNQENSSKSPVEPLGSTETSKSFISPGATGLKRPDTASSTRMGGRVPDNSRYHKPIVSDEDPEGGLRDATAKAANGSDRDKELRGQPKQGHSTHHISSPSEHPVESRFRNESQTRDTKGYTMKQSGSTSHDNAQTNSHMEEASSKKDVKETFDYMPPTPADWVPVNYGAQPRVADGDGAWGDDFSEAEEMAALLAEEELLQAGKRSGLFGGAWGGSETFSFPKSNLLTPSLISIESCSSDEERTDGNGHYEIAEAEAEGCEEAVEFDSRKCQPKQLEFSSHDDRTSKTSSRRKSSHGRQKSDSGSKMLVPFATKTTASSPECKGRSSLSSHSSDFPPPGEESSLLAHTGHSMEDVSCARKTVRDTMLTNERTPLRGLRRLGSFFRSP